MATSGIRTPPPSRRAAVRRRIRRPPGRAGRTRRPSRRRWVWALLLLAILAGGAGLLAQRLGWLEGTALRRMALRGFTTPAGREATLYFADPRWTRLVPEVRRLPVGLDAVGSLKALVAALAEGPREGGAPVLPATAKLRGAYLGEDGLALIDFEPDLGTFQPGGVSGELLTVFALVHTLAENVPGIRSVQILVNGEERSTLAGHVKISEPLEPDPQWTAARE